MTALARVELHPIGAVIEVEPGTPLRDVLFDHGVEFPCGGLGRCGTCRVHVLRGRLPPGPDDERILDRRELADGWRLACRARVRADVVLEVEQWSASILTDESLLEVRPASGLGIAVDLGTTTLVAQLVDRATSRVLGVQTALNPQARHGADVMSRIELAIRGGGAGALRDLVRGAIGRLIAELLGARVEPPRAVERITVVGNTAMHHLFCGIDPSPLAAFPFEPSDGGLQVLRASELGWSVPGDPETAFLPCLGGFVGSDVLAGILATGIDRAPGPSLLLDLGTNGEIVVADREGLLCASTAAGPAFEGARIDMGMRAARGAISHVSPPASAGGAIECRIVGGGAPRGLCGSGLVSAVAVGLDGGQIDPSGRITAPAREWVLSEPVRLIQQDVRELQLAKGAIAAGTRILERARGLDPDEIDRVWLAGAFGNYVDRDAARRIGLLPFAPDRIEPAGNTALRGARLALFAPEVSDCEYRPLRDRVEHIGLSTDPKFQELYIESMRFPSPSSQESGA